MKKRPLILLLMFVLLLGRDALSLDSSGTEGVTQDIDISTGSITSDGFSGATIDFTNFDLVAFGGTITGRFRITLAGGVNLSGGTAGGANTIDFGSGTDDDLSATDVTDLTDTGTTTLHSHPAIGILHALTLDDGYNNDTSGDAQITVDARDVSFNLADATNDYKVVIDNTSTGAIAVALEVTTSGGSVSVPFAIDVRDADIVDAINVGGNDITGKGYQLTSTNSIAGVTIAPAAGGDVIIISNDWAVDAAGNMTNVTSVLNDSGSASTPSYRFSADLLGEGLYSSAANDIRFVTTGAAEFRVFDTTGTGSDGVYFNLAGKATTNGLCHANSGAGDQEQIVDCSGTPGDLAEWYETQKNVESGDLVVVSDRSFSYRGVRLNEKNAPLPSDMQKASILERSTKPYQKNLLGVVSTAPYQVMGEDLRDAKGVKHPLPLALVGRVAVKVSGENGGIEIGDPITSSSVAGVGMKATHSGPMVGRALEPYRGGGIGKIMVAVERGAYFSNKDQKIMEEFSKELQRDKMADSRNIESLMNIPPSVLHKLAYMSRTGDPLTTTIDTTLVVRGDIMRGQEGMAFETSFDPYVVIRGGGALRNGVATVFLDPLFLEVAHISQSDPMLVQVTSTSFDIQHPLVVSERTERSFTVREANGGETSAPFVWEVSAKRKPKENPGESPGESPRENQR